MLTWKFLAPVTAALIGGGITVATLAHAAEFTCTAPWYTDTTCGIPKFSIPPQGQAQVQIYTLRVNGKKYTESCPSVTFFDANTDKAVAFAESVCESQATLYGNPFKDSEQIVYVRIKIPDMTTVDITGMYHGGK